MPKKKAKAHHMALRGHAWNRAGSAERLATSQHLGVWLPTTPRLRGFSLFSIYWFGETFPGDISITWVLGTTSATGLNERQGQGGF